MASGTSRMVLHDDEHEPNQEVVKCVVVGDTGVGKTKLVCAQACATQYTLPQLMQSAHVSTVWAIDHYKFDQEVRDKSWLRVDDVSVSLRLWDTFGYHDKDRQFAYGRADVVLVCFSLVKPKSLHNVKHIWYREISKQCPGTPVVLCGCQADLRYLYIQEDFIKLDKGLFFKAIQESDVIFPEMGRAVAKEISAPYYETSALTRSGIQSTFENVVRIALFERRRHRFWMSHLKSIQKPLPQAPLLPPRPKLPEVKLPDNPILEDLSRLLHTGIYSDITFIVQGQQLHAHSLILAAACKTFWEVLKDCCELEKSQHISSNDLQNANYIACSTTSDTVCLLSSGMEVNDLPESRILVSNLSDYHCRSLLTSVADVFTSCTSFGSSSKLQGSSSYTRDCVESSQEWRRIFPLIEIVDNSSTGDRCHHVRAVITVHESVRIDVFQYILSYLYSGRAHQSTVLPEVIEIAQILQLDCLVKIISNLGNNEVFLNAKLQTTFYEERRELLVNKFLRSALLTDVVFKLDDGSVAAHKPLLVARCEMMDAMFTDNFKESSAKEVCFPGVSCMTFMALLEYLYSGCCPTLNDVDIIELIGLANRLCLTHLVALVESHVIKQLQCEVDNGEDIMEDVIYLLESCQLHNATHLALFCLYHLSTNYTTLYKRHHKLLKNLSEENQTYLAKHRYPPVWYIKEADLYDRNSREIEIRQREKIVHRKRRGHSSGCLCFVGRNRRRYSADAIM